MRTFIALELPQAVKKELTNCQRELEKTGVQARWVKPKLSHLTLAFLGSITPEKREKIEVILEDTTKQVKPFSLHLQKMDVFPNPAKPRIIFIDLGGELEKLHLLATFIKQGLKKEKLFFDQKPFVSHITLGRMKKKQNLRKIISQIKPEKVGFVADKVSLKQSTLTPTGPVYRTLKSLSL